MEREVTIVVLIILAGITLNAVIGENGIIFQSKETKNMIANETEYDNQQLAQLQNELKDNELYSGIGIIPGTDIGGGSEGGENGTWNPGGGGTNQGGSGTNSGGQTNQGGSSGDTNTGGNPSRPNTNTGGGGQISGITAKDPTIYVLAGEEIAASVYRSDVTLQIITNEDKTQRIKYVLTSTVKEIMDELYPTGLIRELDIENGGTLTLTKEGEYTLTAYAYDEFGNKSNPTAIWLKIQKSGEGFGTGISVTLTSGIEGKDGWYTSNLTYRVLGQDKGSSRVTYRVTGIAKSNGRIDKDYQIGEIDTGEVDIANGTTFKIEIDGEFEIRAYTYDNGGTRLSEATVLKVKRDASKPIILNYTGNQEIKDTIDESGFLITLNSQDLASGLATTKKYTYRYKLASVMDYSEEDSENTTKMYQGLEQNKTYDMYALVRDQAGNIIASDIISKPALWVSNNPTVGEMVNGGKEGARVYYSSNIDVGLTGQDKKTANIGKVTYQILGTTTSEGEIDGKTYPFGTALPTEEKEMENQKTIPIQVDGNWTIKIHTYNTEGVKVTTNTLEVTRDTTDPEPPTIEVVNGEMGDDTYYRSDIEVRATGQDSTSYKRTTYVVTGVAAGAGKIGNTNITANQNVNFEAEITNGTTFKIQADGRWTIKGYTYDKVGKKSQIAEGIVVTRDTVNPVANTPVVASGDVGEPSYYRSNVTVKIAGSDTNFKKITYQITGTAKGANGNGIVGNTTVTENQTINTGEVDIANNGTFTVEADGQWTVTTYIYDKSGRKATSGNLVFTRDTVKPKISNFIKTASAESTINVAVSGDDALAGLATMNNSFQYFLGDTLQSNSAADSYRYTGLTGLVLYELKTTCTDRAGNVSDIAKLSAVTPKRTLRFSNGMYTVVIPVDGLYKFELYGGEGGSASATCNSTTVTGTGGLRGLRLRQYEFWC